MGTHDGHVIGATKIVDNGPDNRRFNIVVVAQGYLFSRPICPASLGTMLRERRDVTALGVG